MFVFRVDGNEQIGIGHIMRCLSIADAAKKRGHKVVFVTADGVMSQTIVNRQYHNIVLQTDYLGMEQEIASFQQKLEAYVQLELSESGQSESEPSWMIVDSYQATEVYFHLLKEAFPSYRIAVLDDMFWEQKEADCLINYNIYGEAYPYKKEQQLQLLGCQFVPLREQFLAASQTENWNDRKPERQQGIHSILVSTGGSDSLRIAEAILKKSIEYPWTRLQEKGEQIFFHVICGAMNPNKEALFALEGQYPDRIRIHYDVKDMAGLIKQCELGISAAGSTVYELAVMGIPFVLYYFVENQRRMAEFCGQKLGICNAGDYSIASNQVLTRIVSEVEELCVNQNKRMELGAYLRKQVDGKGAERMIEQLEGYRA